MPTYGGSAVWVHVAKTKRVSLARVASVSDGSAGAQFRCSEAGLGGATCPTRRKVQRVKKCHDIDGRQWARFRSSAGSEGAHT
jgi:hypothetical protein